MKNELLYQYFAGALTDEKKRMLFDQLDTDALLLDEFIRLRNTFAVSGMIHHETDDAWSKQKLEEIPRKPKAGKRRHLTLSLLKYAAVASLLACTWLISDYYHQEKPQEIAYTYVEVPKGQRASLTLPDGSQVYLNSRTKLKFSNHFNRNDRVVELDGEGFFSVEKNTELPFVVSTGKYNVEVTGTQFNVFAYSQSELFETDLVEGAVFVYKSTDKEHKLFLLPEEKAFIVDGQLQKSTSRFIHSQRLRDGVYSFEDNSFQEIIDKLSLWYDVRFQVRNPAVLSLVFSGKFRQNDSINLIMQAIKKTGKFNYRIIEKDLIEIY